VPSLIENVKEEKPICVEHSVILIDDDDSSIETKSESNNLPKSKVNLNKNKVLGMTIPILVLEPRKSLPDEPNLKSLENIRANYVIDQVGKSLFSTIKSQSIKPTSTPTDRRRPLKNMFKDVSMIGTPDKGAKENNDGNPSNV